MTKNKYKGRSLSWLLNKAQYWFNRYIRLRDYGKPCISCDSTRVAHASHFYPVGQYPSLRFNEMNAHGSCVYCNTYLYGNLHEYRKKIPYRIGHDALDILDDLADISKQKSFKWQRHEVIETIEKYRNLCKNIEKTLKS